MIDTIILTIPKEKIISVDMSYYGTPVWDLQARTRMYDKYVKNPSSQDMASGLYFPYITGYRRKNNRLEWDQTIRIQFSAPKLIYYNNLDELSESQFSAVVSALRDRLERMGIRITRQDLENASVVSVHYARNVVLKDGFTAQYVISQLGKIHLNKRFDFSRARFTNDGQCLYAHTNTHEFVIYDKIADLNKDKKRSTDREQTAYQLGLFEKLKESHEIVRFEARLAQKKKMNSLFKQLGFVENPTFKDVFSAEKSKGVLMHYWNTMIEKNSLLLFAYSFTPKDMLNQVLLARKDIKAVKAIYLAGLLILAPDGNGIRELRTILSKRNRDRTWYRIYADLNETIKQLSKLRPREWYTQVQRALSTNKPYHIDSS
jgi:hypothetical protein